MNTLLVTAVGGGAFHLSDRPRATEAPVPNRLIDETSPYLQQHAHNPVDWYPWGEEALARARAEGKPIFLSIGYSACHWCHVMERESFEDPATAEVMNEHFVNIKVDREERPDLDTIYMKAVVALTGRGGWPMSVWLTPQLAPFFGGTYFPDTPRGGMPSFVQVLDALAAAWEEKPDDIARSAERLTMHLRDELGPLADGVTDEMASSAQDVEASVEGGVDEGPLADVVRLPVRGLDAEVLVGMTQGLLSAFDKRNGGWGGAPKFPQPMAIEFLLRRSVHTGDAQALHVAEFTLQKMSAGGMYDQLGGGFHRYSVDAVWLVPHFEKMLYDNALLARTYVHALQVTGNPLYGRIAEETLAYVLREMTDESGAFYSTQDADSEGEEGRFFLWTPEQVEEVLAPEDARLFGRVFGVVPGGNFEGRSILHLARDPRDVGEEAGLTEIEVVTSLAVSRRRLFEAREERVRPARDEKVLTSWNGLMLAAFADAGRALGRQDFTRTAEENARFILTHLRDAEGRLHRTYKDGRARLNGYLEDYAYVTEGLLALYQATFDERWFVAARELADQMLAHFAAPGGGFYDTADDHEELIVRPQDLQDNATPSGNAMAATALLRLAAYTGDARYADAVEPLMVHMRDLLERYPLAFAQWLTAYDFATTPGGPVEIAIVGDPDAPDTMALVDEALAGYHPERVVALKRPAARTEVPLLAGREMLQARDPESGPVSIASRSTLAGRATAYVCRAFTCREPVTDPTALRAQLV